MKGQSYPQVPGVAPSQSDPLPGAQYVRCVNKHSGPVNGLAGDATGSDVVIHDTTAANNVPGKPIPIKLTTTAGRLTLGVVAHWERSIPVNGECWVQIAGLHPGVKIDGTTDIVNGNNVGDHTVAGAGAVNSSVNSLGNYVDADYSDNAVAAKKVFLRNPMGVRASQVI